ncbi:putative ACR [Tepidimonas sediminis]|uniref:Putative ACR n=1 Tax=Tepidimonas sediminis TaxID=2588941 RepID=A0A554WM05_9BURK|nr:DUF192 domain-containing protein [Tepidimonas sediminis]TSE24599.1 putative ACR [Tepidimonas sediminis]
MAHRTDPSPARAARRRRLAALAALLALAGAGRAQPAAEPPGRPQLDLPRVTLRAGLHLIDAQVAATHAQRALGLMWRRELAPNEGMLFVFEAPAVQCFWMRNTFVPLTAAFIAEDGRIVNLADMRPLDETGHCSAEPVRYVLEMTRGWFARRGIGPGFRLAGGPFGGR